MLKELLPIVPRDALNIALVLALSFFIGLEREEDKKRKLSYAFGGIRTFPLISLVSYALALISAPQFLPWTLGFAVIGGFMLLSYGHALEGDPPAGFTGEISALATYVVGGLVQREYYWLATTLGVLSVLLLELKKGLEGLTKHFASNEIITVAKFLVLAVVILPVVPDQTFTRYEFNPFKIWLVVVAVSGISFASYVLQRVVKSRGGVMLSAILGGVYSSTVTTVVLARRAKSEKRPNLYAGGIITASGMMYARLALLLLLFNGALAARLAPAFGALCVAAAGAGYWTARHSDGNDVSAVPDREARNPLELGTAFLFAAVFLGILVVTNLASVHLGSAGLYALAVVMGVADVDPFILGVSQTSAAAMPLHVAAWCVLIAASSNNVVKAIYAYSFADRTTGRKSAALLFALAALGMIPLAFT